MHGTLHPNGFHLAQSTFTPPPPPPPPPVAPPYRHQGAAGNISCVQCHWDWGWGWWGGLRAISYVSLLPGGPTAWVGTPYPPEHNNNARVPNVYTSESKTRVHPSSIDARTEASCMISQHHERERARARDAHPRTAISIPGPEGGPHSRALHPDSPPHASQNHARLRGHPTSQFSGIPAHRPPGSPRTRLPGPGLYTRARLSVLAHPRAAYIPACTRLDPIPTKDLAWLGVQQGPQHPFSQACPSPMPSLPLWVPPPDTHARMAARPELCLPPPERLRPPSVRGG
jgi:hypothetical protein